MRALGEQLKQTLEWIAVDWGTSNLRAWGIAADGQVIFTRASDKGMSKLDPDEFPLVLAELLGEDVKSDQSVDVVICGMAGARQGWQEAPYLETPADLKSLGARAVAPPIEDRRFRPRILSGVCQPSAGFEDVMRGEETQILGLLALKPDFEGTICMPGTHSKWVKIEGGQITSFSTVMTGELFEVMRTHSVLRHSMPQELTGEKAEEGISAGLAKGIEEPHLLTANLFKARSASLLSGRTPDWCAGYLSGLLVGTEVASHRDWCLTQPVPLIGSARLCRLYTTALNLMGFEAETIDATQVTLAGLTAARKQINHD